MCYIVLLLGRGLFRRVVLLFAYGPFPLFVCGGRRGLCYIVLLLRRGLFRRLIFLLAYGLLMLFVFRRSRGLCQTVVPLLRRGPFFIVILLLRHRLQQSGVAGNHAFACYNADMPLSDGGAHVELGVQRFGPQTRAICFFLLDHEDMGVPCRFFRCRLLFFHQAVHHRPAHHIRNIPDRDTRHQAKEGKGMIVIAVLVLYHQVQRHRAAKQQQACVHAIRRTPETQEAV